MQAELITEILEKFSASAATELDFHDETCRLILRKGNAFAAASPAVPEAPRRFFPEEEKKSEEGEKKSEEKKGKKEKILSPLVAAFYASAGPDSPPFVSAGSQVKKGDTLCILEAMKMMNHLEAEFDCEILAVLAKSGEMVEFGQPLFEVKIF